MEWQIVGYHAVDHRQRDVHRCKDGLYLCSAEVQANDLEPQPFGGNLCHQKGADTQAWRFRVKTLKGRLPKSPGKIGSEALERPNYVVLRLQGKENMAVMFAQSVFKAISESCAFEMSADAWDGSGHLRLPGEWILDISLFLAIFGRLEDQGSVRVIVGSGALMERPIPRAVS